jgi:hypothetical protein
VSARMAQVRSSALLALFSNHVFIFALFSHLRSRQQLGG